MNNLADLEIRLQYSKTIDKHVQEQIKKEREYWKSALVRIVAIVKNLAKNNLAFHGKNGKIFQENNGNFLGLIEMIAKFDPIMIEHVRHIKMGEIQNHYPGHKMQNELIDTLAYEIKKTNYYKD